MRKKISVVTAILKNSDDQILIVQRPLNKELGGFWEFPGGKIEAGESADKALQRELKEEINIYFELEDLTLLTTFMHTSPDKDIDFTFYTLTKWQGDIHLNESQPQYAWVAPQLLDHYQMPTTNLKVYPLLAAL